MRPFLLPAILLGSTLAIGTISLVGTVTRPRVSGTVQAILQQYTAPGVMLGARVRDIKSVVKAPFTFVPHLGFVANPRDNTGASQLRLLLSVRDREQKADDGDRVEAIELVTSAKDATTTLLLALAGKFPGAPREGCVSVGALSFHREVRYWAAPNARGGVAVISDFGGDPAVRAGDPVVVSLLAFAGPFDGAHTLRAKYAAQSCAKLVGLVP
ncbi:MAG: hypothetical protein ACHQQ3_14900 [Gemmatimonadales bacterium]